MAHLGRLEVIPENENVFERLERLLREHGLRLWSDRGETVVLPADGWSIFHEQIRQLDEKISKVLLAQGWTPVPDARNRHEIPPPPPTAPYAEKHPPRPSSLEGRPTIPDQLRADVPLHVELARKAVAGAVVAGLAAAFLGIELFFAGLDVLNALVGGRS